MNEINKVDDVTSSRGAQWMGASGIIALAAKVGFRAFGLSSPAPTFRRTTQWLSRQAM